MMTKTEVELIRLWRRESADNPALGLKPNKVSLPPV
jgi:hypothetical protein